MMITKRKRNIVLISAICSFVLGLALAYFSGSFDKSLSLVLEYAADILGFAAAIGAVYLIIVHTQKKDSKNKTHNTIKEKGGFIPLIITVVLAYILLDLWSSGKIIEDPYSGTSKEVLIGAAGHLIILLISVAIGLFSAIIIKKIRKKLNDMQ